MSLRAYEMFMSVFFIVIAVWFIVQAQNLPPAVTQGDVGPATFPGIISVLIILFSIAQIGMSLKKNSDNVMPVVIKRWKAIVGVMVTFILYALLMPKVGYYVSTAIFVPVMLLLATEFRWIRIILVTTFFILFSLIIFDILLNVPLP